MSPSCTPDILILQPSHPHPVPFISPNCNPCIPVLHPSPPHPAFLVSPSCTPHILILHPSHPHPSTPPSPSCNSCTSILHPFHPHPSKPAPPTYILHIPVLQCQVSGLLSLPGSCTECHQHGEYVQCKVSLEKLCPPRRECFNQQGQHQGLTN